MTSLGEATTAAMDELAKKGDRKLVSCSYFIASHERLGKSLNEQTL